jgi:hypothetical protein
MKKISLAALCAFALLASGCGKEEKVSAPATDIRVTKKGDAVTFEMKGKDEKTNVTIAGSDKGVPLPDKFPTDVPVMPGAIVKVAMATGEGMSVQFSVKASQADAVKYYEENLKTKGWTIEATMNSAASSMISAKKGKRECVLNIITDAGGSIVQVLVPSEKG